MKNGVYLNFMYMYTCIFVYIICYFLSNCILIIKLAVIKFIVYMKCVCFRMYVVHITAVYLFYFGTLYYIYNNFEIVRVGMDYITEKLKLLPIIGGLVEKFHLWDCIRIQSFHVCHIIHILFNAHNKEENIIIPFLHLFIIQCFVWGFLSYL